MPDFDLVIRNGTVATATDVFDSDIGIRDGVIVALGQGLGAGAQDYDARGKLVLPGGIDSHTHIAEPRTGPTANADSFASGSASAALGGTTTVIGFARQALHAAVLGFVHPVSGTAVRFASVAPQDMQELLHELGSMERQGMRSV